MFLCEDNFVERILIPGGQFTMGLSDVLEEELYQLTVETFDMEHCCMMKFWRHIMVPYWGL
jgi:hypothetical protein